MLARNNGSSTMLTGGCYIEGKYQLLKNTHSAEMGSFKGKSEILRTVTEAAIFQKARKAFGFPASI